VAANEGEHLPDKVIECVILYPSDDNDQIILLEFSGVRFMCTSVLLYSELLLDLKTHVDKRIRMLPWGPGKCH